MDGADGIGRLLIVGGVVIAVVGLVMVVAPMLLLSIVLTIVLNLISRR